MKYKIMKKMSKPCNFTTLSTGTNKPLVTYGLVTLTFRIALWLYAKTCVLSFEC